ncbi:hypothetical protein [Spirosoma radiotolerans]|uniref:Uncharacterized protein n=1 Tax=Spirosoma radiotolerans TaxID=1379870 RepID=A0A0E3ZXS7_9BACT|nr:hypothetical protein [Spirosoma radiotolerans]AKD57103.1 hypothetical protein SD10_21625 [Spirosoma radiotolerans]
MLRVLFDDHGSGTKDLFIKIDGSPTHVWIADSTWLGAFFNTDEGNSWTDDDLITAKKTDISLLIRLWQKMLLSDQPLCYLPVCLADQSGGALKIAKNKRLYHISIVGSTDMIDGVTEAYYLQKQYATTWQSSVRTQREFEWDLALSSILTGLNWSLAQLEQPIIPLQY